MVNNTFLYKLAKIKNIINEKMKKIIILISLMLWPQIVFWNQNELDKIEITIQNKIFYWNTLQKNLDNIINLTTSNNLEKKEIIYKKLSNKLNELNKSENIYNIKKIIDYSLNKTTNELEIYYKKVKKITLWYTKNWEEIYAYYSWKPDNWYFWIFSNIHGWYEYGTYETANYLVNEFEKEWITWWFIIPTINPEWLEYYKNSTIKYDAFIEGRVNKNNVDLNRNFCTKNYELKNFIKNWLNILTWLNNCESESETRIIIDTLKKYKFNKIISLHSKWNILFIPDNSIDDKKVIDFWYEISNILPTYKYDINFENDYVKKQKINEYEINEWWNAEYTWTMETYIYEKYNIPIILIELPDHWKIEYKLKDLKNIIK